MWRTVGGRWDGGGGFAVGIAWELFRVSWVPVEVVGLVFVVTVVVVLVGVMLNG